mmetsp:Transcript_14828/g.30698  ORF Transcript_14828/g.30698 Transcript_14828/m.30698 type:complete len:150 (-) Transcript_14828:20-469(-)
MSSEDEELASLLSNEERLKRMNLTEDEIREFYLAFKGMDENGDKRLQREEIQEMLSQIGYEFNDTILDRLFKEASQEGRSKGLDLAEFLDLMSLEKSARGSRTDSVEGAIHQNIEQVLVYSSLRGRGGIPAYVLAIVAVAVVVLIVYLG